jgi:rubrerythrin
MEVFVRLENGPECQQSIGETFRGRDLPPELAGSRDKRIYCPKTGRHYAQKNQDRVFLIPIKSERAPVHSIKVETPTNSNRMPVLLDKLGERLSFERQGTLLYEAFLRKVQSAPVAEVSARAEDLRRICDQENEHFRLLENAIKELGGDPAVPTPSAGTAGVLSHGILEIVNDPTTTIAQTVQAILNVELVDNDGWQMLIELASELRQSKLEVLCKRALQEEREHLGIVRAWLSQITLGREMGVD